MHNVLIKINNKDDINVSLLTNVIIKMLFFVEFGLLLFNLLLFLENMSHLFYCTSRIPNCPPIQ